MFGFLSLPKLLFTVAVVVAVWYGFKWIGRRQQLRDARAREDVRAKVRKERAGAGRQTVEDMVQCPDCGAYVPDDGSHKCG